ncbi:LINE-1 retrotransposable element O protein [Sesamum angolense]|uniref:LINE-1 retrotransposable element O protein n=1 Tax=Sesamum angolense TaxID=2727404 RepID=A0AAE1T3K1_9LAMI|nr:LINE-1 retrotransposable element O protein [Sesamum angolense]
MAGGGREARGVTARGRREGDDGDEKGKGREGRGAGEELDGWWRGGGEGEGMGGGWFGGGVAQWVCQWGDDMNEALIQPFSPDEVKLAIFPMYPYKSPGPDGMSQIFYQKYWHIVGTEITSFVLEFLNHLIFYAKFNHTYVVLVPKCSNPESMSRFHPISLCSITYKIASKVLANRLKPLLQFVISKDQSAFVPGRLITDNMLVAYEINHYLAHKYGGSVGHAPLKLDLSKVYDRVEWTFLERVLAKLVRYLDTFTPSGISDKRLMRNYEEWLLVDMALGWVLELFEKASGLKVNVEKSSVAFSHNNPVASRDSLANVLGVTVVERLMDSSACFLLGDYLPILEMLAAKTDDVGSTSFQTGQLEFYLERHGSPKGLSFHLEGLSESFPTSCNLAYRDAAVEGYCSCCGLELEVLFHMLLRCHFARLVWALSHISWEYVYCDHNDLEAWFRGLHMNLDKNSFGRALLICWYLWWAQNKFLFENVILPVNEDGNVISNYWDQEEQLRHQPPSSPMQVAQQTLNSGTSLEDITKSLAVTALQIQHDTRANLMPKSKDDEGEILNTLNKVKINIPLLAKNLVLPPTMSLLGVKESLYTIISQGLFKEQNELKLDEKEVLRNCKEKTKRSKLHIGREHALS